MDSPGLSRAAEYDAAGVAMVLVMLGYVAGTTHAGDNRNLIAFALGGEVDPAGLLLEVRGALAAARESAGLVPADADAVREAERLVSFVEARWGQSSSHVLCQGGASRASQRCWLLQRHSVHRSCSVRSASDRHCPPVCHLSVAAA